MLDEGLLDRGHVANGNGYTNGHGHCNGAKGHGANGHGYTNGHGDCNGHGHTDALSHGHGHEHHHEASRERSGSGISLQGSEGNLVQCSIDWLRAHDPSECRTPQHLAQDCCAARCDHSQLSVTTNVIVMVRANELIAMSRVNSFLAITAVLYIGVNIICTVLNSYDNDCDPSQPSCDRAATPAVFHRLEFWGTFVFNTVDVFALSYSPKNLSNQYANPTLLKIIVLFNVGMSFISSMLVTINLDKFETPAHELEYLNELTMTLFDGIILLDLGRGRSHQTNFLRSILSKIGLLVVAAVAMAQMIIYNCSGWTSDGDSKGEQAAHYLEFTFGIISAGITFWFTMDNKISADLRLRQIMYTGYDRLEP